MDLMDLLLPKASKGRATRLALFTSGLAAVCLSMGTSILISDELRLAVYRFASCSILALYAGLVICYTLGSELAFRRLETSRDAYEAGIAYGLQFLWGFGVPIAVSALLSHLTLTDFSSAPGIIALALGVAALRLNWEAVALRFGSVRECGSSFDRRIETFVAGPVFEAGAVVDVPTKALATTGPYAEMRHPGFAAHILQQTANALLVAAFVMSERGSPAELVAIVGISAAFAYLVFEGAARSEERSLQKMPAYREYMRKVPARFSLSFRHEQQSSWTSDILGLLHGMVIHGSLRSVYLRLIAAVQGVRVEYVDPVREPEVVDRVLSATGDKGTFVEDLAACPAWRPILSVESVDVPLARDLRSRLERVKAALRIDERVPGIVDSALKDLEMRLEAKEDAILDHKELCHLTFDIFFRLLTGRAPYRGEVTIALNAVEEWKAEIAMKKRADEAAKEALLSIMRRALRESPFFNDIAFDPDDVADLSCVMQPLCISPMINFPDLFAGAKELLSASPAWVERGAESEEVADMIVLETIRLRHPFPVLERAVNTGQDECRFNAPGSRRFRAGTQVFIEYDNRALLGGSEFDPERWREYVRLGKKHVTASARACPYKAIPFGAGPRRCAGQNLARSVLRRTLRWALREFPLRKQMDQVDGEAFRSSSVEPCLTRSWDNFEPASGHKYSGRNNDENDQDTNVPHMAFRLLQILGRSIVIGFKRRLGLDSIFLAPSKSKCAVPRAG